MAKIVVVYAEKTDDVYVAHMEHPTPDGGVMKTMSLFGGPSLPLALQKAEKWNDALGGIEIWIRHRNGSVYQHSRSRLGQIMSKF